MGGADWLVPALCT